MPLFLGFEVYICHLPFPVLTDSLKKLHSWAETIVDYLVGYINIIYHTDIVCVFF